MNSFTNFLICLALCSGWLLLSAQVTAAPVKAARGGTHHTVPSNSTDPNGRGVDADWRQDMLLLVNQQRVQNGLKPLKIDDRLNDAAQDHSNYQAQIHQLTHDDAAGPLSTRVSSTGVAWTRLGENVASGPQEVDKVVELWVGSPGHYANIVGDFNYVGFGLAYDDDEHINGRSVPFWTQVYAKEPKVKT